MNTIGWVSVKLRGHARAVLLLFYLVGCTFPGAGTVSAQLLGGKLKPGTVALRDAGAPSLVVSAVPGSIPYRLAQACDAANPLLTFTVQVANQGTGASPAQPAAIVVAEDVSLSPPWTGQATLPAMARGQVLAVNIPVMVYSQPAAMKGTHMFRITVRGTPSSTSSINLQVNIPDGLCAAAINQRSAPGSPAPPAFTPPLKTVMGGQLKGSTATTGQQLPANTEVAKNTHILGQPAGTPASLPHAMTVTGTPPTLPQGRGYIKMVLGSGQTVSGEVREPAHAGWLEFTHEADPPLAADPTTKPGEAKHIVADIAITKTTDKTSPVLMQAAANGTRFKEVGMDFVRKDASGQEFVYQRFKLADVVVTSIHPGGSGEHGPTESVRLHYTSLSSEPVGTPLAATTPLKTATLPGSTTPTPPLKTAMPSGAAKAAVTSKFTAPELRAQILKSGKIVTSPVITVPPPPQTQGRFQVHTLPAGTPMQEVKLTIFPNTEAGFWRSEDAGAPIDVSMYTPSSTDPLFPGRTAVVTRSSANDSSPNNDWAWVGQNQWFELSDYFGFKKLASGFAVSRYQIELYDLHQVMQDLCQTRFAGKNAYVKVNPPQFPAQGTWDAYQMNLSVSADGWSCDAFTDQIVGSMKASDYAITVWVCGPKGVNPWTGGQLPPPPYGARTAHLGSLNSPSTGPSGTQQSPSPSGSPPPPSGASGAPSSTRPPSSGIAGAAASNLPPPLPSDTSSVYSSDDNQLSTCPSP